MENVDEKGKKLPFYSLKEIKKRNAQYNLIIGERSNGKTFAVQEEGLKNYVSTGKQMALIRRYDTDFTGKRGREMFKGIVEENIVKELTHGEWTHIAYWSSCWYLARFDNELNKEVRSQDPFCYGFALNTQEHDKSTTYPRVTTILFDEFLTRGIYLTDEFITFTNVLSTIIRLRDDVTIYMCANTVNKYAPYFMEMGLRNVQKMEQDTIDVYTYGDSKLRVAVEYCGTSKRLKKKSDVYFAFDNPRLNMITKGTWEIPQYPHPSKKFSKTDIRYTYFIEFYDNLLQCEIVYLPECNFTYIHRKTSQLQKPDKDLIYSVEYSEMPNRRRKITQPANDLERKIYSYYKKEKIFYQDNEVGETVRNYINWCQSDKGIV